MMSSEMGRDRAWNYGIPARKAGQNSVRRIEIEEIHGELDFLLQNGYKENNADTQTRRYYTKLKHTSHWLLQRRWWRRH
jgi:hypothetical protein